MDDYAEQTHFEDDQLGYNGEEFHEEFQDLEHQQQEREQFDSEPRFEPGESVDVAGNGMRHSTGHRDSVSPGLVRFSFGIGC